MSCLVTKHGKHTTMLSYKEIAYEKYGTDTMFLPGPDEKFVLCMKKIDRQSVNPNEVCIFFVYSIEQQKVIYSDSIPGTTLSWYSNTELLVKKQKGIINNVNDSGKITELIDLINSKTKTIRKIDNEY